MTYQTTDDDGNVVDADTADVASGAALNWPDVDGVFPSANRGWGYAGYNADGEGATGGDPLVESQFDLTAGLRVLRRGRRDPRLANAR